MQASKIKQIDKHANLVISLIVHTQQITNTYVLTI